MINKDRTTWTTGWIVKVGEFKQVDIMNIHRYIDTWNEKMVDDDNDRYTIE